MDATTPPAGHPSAVPSTLLPGLRSFQEGTSSPLRLPSLFPPANNSFIPRSDGVYRACDPAEGKSVPAENSEAKMYTFLNWEESRAIHPTSDVPAPALHPVLQSCSAFSPKATLLDAPRDTPRSSISVLETNVPGRAPTPLLPYHVQPLPQIPLGSFPAKSGSVPSNDTHSPPLSSTSPRRASTSLGDTSIQNQEAQSTKRKRPSRARHNMAEQKRRQQMRDSFDRLKTLLPNMDKKMSKVTLLNETYDYISQLKQNAEKLNEEILSLKAELAESERRRKKEKKKRKEMSKKERRKREEGSESRILIEKDYPLPPQKRLRPAPEEQISVASHLAKSPSEGSGSATEGATSQL